MDKQRIFLQNLSHKFEIKHPSDWSKVSLWRIEESGGHKISQIYKRDISTALRNSFPGTHYCSPIETRKKLTGKNLGFLKEGRNDFYLQKLKH